MNQLSKLKYDVIGLCETRAKTEETSGLRAELAKLEEQNSALLASLDDAQAGQSELATNLAALKAIQPKVSDAEHNALLENLAALKGELSEARQLSENSQLEVQNKIVIIIFTNWKVVPIHTINYKIIIINYQFYSFFIIYNQYLITLSKGRKRG